MPIQQVSSLDIYCPCGKCELCQSGWPWIVELVRGCVSGRVRDHVDREDVAQEAAVLLLRHGYRPGRMALKSWASRLAAFSVGRYFRDRRRHPLFLSDCGEHTAQADVEARAIARVDAAALLKGCPTALRPVLGQMADGVSFRAAVLELGLAAHYEALKKTFFRWRTRVARHKEATSERC